MNGNALRPTFRLYLMDYLSCLFNWRSFTVHSTDLNTIQKKCLHSLFNSTRCFCCCCWHVALFNGGLIAIYAQMIVGVVWWSNKIEYPAIINLSEFCVWAEVFTWVHNKTANNNNIYSATRRIWSPVSDIPHIPCVSGLFHVKCKQSTGLNWIFVLLDFIDLLRFIQPVQRAFISPKLCINDDETRTTQPIPTRYVVSFDIVHHQQSSILRQGIRCRRSICWYYPWDWMRRMMREIIKQVFCETDKNTRST